MARLGQYGDTSMVKPEDMNKKRSGLLVLAEGWYRAALDKDRIEEKEWGQLYSAELRILEGEYEGYVIFDRLCLEHRSKEKAERMGRTKLAELGKASGHKTPHLMTETDSIMGRPIMVRIYRSEASDSKYADADGCQANVDQYMSVSQWQEERGDEPRPGVTTPAVRANELAGDPKPREKRTSKPASSDWTMAEAREAKYANDDIPF